MKILSLDAAVWKNRTGGDEKILEIVKCDFRRRERHLIGFAISSQDDLDREGEPLSDKENLADTQIDEFIEFCVVRGDQGRIHAPREC